MEYMDLYTSQKRGTYLEIAKNLSMNMSTTTQ